MTGDQWWLEGIAAVLLGVVIGCAFTAYRARQRFEGRLRRTANELLQRHSIVADELRSSLLRAQTDLELARNEFKRQLATTLEEHRATASKIEEHLLAAYDELERLRATVRGSPSAGPEHSNGFAATQPMVDGL